jgi:hypothetical protein
MSSAVMGKYRDVTQFSSLAAQINPLIDQRRLIYDLPF